MKQPYPMMVASYEGPHCPTCHCAWFTTVSHASGDLKDWIRKCKCCGTVYSTNESLMLVEVMEGEANYGAVIKYAGGMLLSIQCPTLDEVSHRVADAVVNSQAEVIQRPKTLQVPVRTVVR